MKSIFLIIPALLFGQIQAQMTGCTDPLAINYQTEAEINDGSCIYPETSVSPIYSENLPDVMEETSGLLFIDEYLYTFNDDTDTHLYYFHPENVLDYSQIQIPDVTNYDWEEIAQDEEYLYIGDFGNNASGNRTDLKIYRIKKSELNSNPQPEIISFSYDIQTDFTPLPSNTTNFDCEAFIVGQDKIHLFTKEWDSYETSVFELEKTPGNHTAVYKGSLNVYGLITGAEYLEESRFIALSGYNALLQPFIYLLYDFRDDDFFGGNKRRMNISLFGHQVEGIASEDGRKFYISNEKATLFGNTIAQKLHLLDLTEYTNGYLEDDSLSLTVPVSNSQEEKMKLYPNPTKNELNLIFSDSNKTNAKTAQIFDLNRNLLKTYKIQNNKLLNINLNEFLSKKGAYIIGLYDESNQIISSEIFLYY